MNEFNEFKNEMMNINNESNEKMAELFNNTINNQVEKIFEEKFNQHVHELVADKLEKFEHSLIKRVDKDNQNIHDRINQAGEYVVELENKVDREFCNVKDDTEYVKSKVDTLEFNGKSNELRAYMQSKIHRSTGIKKDTIEYTLFFGRLNRALQKEIKDKYGINRYGLLPLSDLQDCKKYINNWFPPSNYKGRYMLEYRERNDKNNLPCTLRKAYHKYLEIHQGVV